ncbi:ketohexokinase-like [Littorina saxatilis]|uniref:Carbohydrate kinase PfkB domain-containing protein n=1 Tax=Littorina saxatilis TaxID=31220 RepID=A0AAN9G605_9CAEN
MASAEDENQGTQTKVLCVGLVCLDIVKVVTHFPVEDTDQRCEDCLWRRGGNASNTSTVLSLLGARPEYLGTLARGPYLQFVQSDFEEHGIVSDHCPVLTQGACPVSLIILNQASGSRTILHTNKNLQELSLDDFQKLSLSSGQYSWIHFEGRPNVEEIRKMLLHVEEHNSSCEESSKVITSLEVEKVDRVAQLRGLMRHVDYVFVSKEAATSLGYTDQQTAVEGLVSNCRDSAAVICPWGEKGASAKRKGSPAVTSPAFPPEVVMDTIGAGDTFNAATIFALNSGKDLGESVTFGCKVAGAKCGMMGNAGLRGMTF